MAAEAEEPDWVTFDDEPPASASPAASAAAAAAAVAAAAPRPGRPAALPRALPLLAPPPPQEDLAADGDAYVSRIQGRLDRLKNPAERPATVRRSRLAAGRQTAHVASAFAIDDDDDFNPRGPQQTQKPTTTAAAADNGDTPQPSGGWRCCCCWRKPSGDGARTEALSEVDGLLPRPRSIMLTGDDDEDNGRDMPYAQLLNESDESTTGGGGGGGGLLLSDADEETETERDSDSAGEPPESHCIN